MYVFLFYRIVSFGILPLHIYIFSPALSVVTFGMILLVYKELADVQTESQAVLDMVGKMPFSFRVSERKELQSCRVLTIQNSIFGPTSRETSGSMIEEIINYVLLMLTGIR